LTVNIDSINRISRKSRVRGTTLLEIMIAMIILASLGLTFFQLIRSSGQMMALTSNSFAAIHIGSKVMSDLYEESRVNTTLLEIMDEFPDMKGTDKVVEGQSVFFRFMKDRKPPWGIINTAVDGGIEKSDGVLYDQLTPFKVTVFSARIGDKDGTDFKKHLAEAVIRVDWKEKDGQGRAYSVVAQIPSPLGAKATETSALVKENELADKIRETLFPDLTGKSLDQAVSSTGCDKDLVYHIGKIAVVTNALSDAMSEIGTDLKNLEKKRKPLIKTPGDELVEIQIQIARKTESGASLLYNVLVELAESVKEIRESATPDKLQDIPPMPFSKGLKCFKTLSTNIPKWVQDAGKAYEWLLEPGFDLSVSMREKEFIRNKVLECHRLLTALEAIPDNNYLKLIQATPSSTQPKPIIELKKFQQFVLSEKAAMTGKNPFLEKFFIREERLSQSPKVLTTAYPNLATIIERLNGVLWSNAGTVTSLIALHPKASKAQK